MEGQYNKGFTQEDNDVSVRVEGSKDKLGSKSDEKIEDEEDDPWKISEVYIKVVPWSELSACGKVKRIVWDYFMKVVILVGFLYLFICSLDFMGNAFKLIGGKAAGDIFSKNEILTNPIAGLMIGVLTTVLIQSSSTTTSIIVSLVAAEFIPVKNAIPMVMGANIGTSVTNTLVSIGQISSKEDFRRAFAGATVHDMFNWLTVLILLPLEIITGYLYRMTTLMVNNMNLETKEGADREFLKYFTTPFTHLIIQVDKKVITAVAKGDQSAMNKTLVKHCCKKDHMNVTLTNLTTGQNYTDLQEQCLKKCQFMFEGIANKWSDSTVGIVLLIMALVLLCVCLVCVVKTLNSLMKGKVSVLIKKFVNSNLPGVFSYFTGYLAILVGTGLTVLVQSSSVFTSTLTPLVGIGVVQIDRMYPLTLGANIGTTTTSILAALAQDASSIKYALQIALCHLFFNISGIVLFFPIPHMRFPIRMAKFLGNMTAEYRWFAIVYLILLFFLIPGLVFGLSMISWIAMLCFVVPVLIIIISVVVINVLQNKCPNALIPVMRTWDFMPEPLRSLAPYDRVMMKVFGCCSCCKVIPDDDKEERIEPEIRDKETSNL